jgi:hypothetical protein
MVERSQAPKAMMVEGGLWDVPLYGRPKVRQKGTPRKPHPSVTIGKAEEARRMVDNATFARKRTGWRNHLNLRTTSLTRAESHGGQGGHKATNSRATPTHPPCPQDPFWHQLLEGAEENDPRGCMHETSWFSPNLSPIPSTGKQGMTCSHNQEWFEW